MQSNNYEIIKFDDGSLMYVHKESDPQLKSIMIDVYQNSKTTELCEIIFKNGSDKSVSHNYSLLYNALFQSLRTLPINLFELGISYVNQHMFDDRYPPTNIPAPSLKAWREYFELANIYGADFDKNTLIQEERIKTFFTNVLDKNALAYLANEVLAEISFDIIIDDAIHDLNPNMNFLSAFYSKLKEGGYFIIEDIGKDSLNIESYLAALDPYKAIIILLNHPSSQWNHINSLAVIKK